MPNTEKSVGNERLTEEFVHIPVLSEEAIAGLAVRAGGHYLDATVGGAGHARLILEAAPDLCLTAIDRDELAIRVARERLGSFGERVNFWQGNFAQYEPGEQQFDGIIADLGVSSAQLDLSERGFSFREEARLDMRMDGRQSLTAEEIVNHWDETELADIFYKYGEERFSRRIARQIGRSRPLRTTTELAEAIARSVPGRYRHGRIHPATRVFQALRIAVNQELASLETFLARVADWLKPEGRLAVISFHSLEDRIVKHRLRESPQLRVLTKKPIRPSEQESQNNPRSRSAKLRIAERVTAIE
ncbi:16S rRNA (cytosine(1402)-N(4))-methyltransferase RsmH [Oxynema sp. CENA135]|uniref:16S rRNA (cytosine(1402)-N(4))-methyltransferase RsmH n=1 Tax=Oxynema sp. CENA135 TaxID=984206 RepID=UPI00351C8872